MYMYTHTPSHTSHIYTHMHTQVSSVIINNGGTVRCRKQYKLVKVTSDKNGNSSRLGVVQ